MRKKPGNLFVTFFLGHSLIRLLFEHTFTGIAKQNWSEFISIHKSANPFLSLASMVGIIVFLMSYFAFYRAFREENCNPNKLARIAKFYYYALLYNIFCNTIEFILETTSFFAYENYTLIDIVFSDSLSALIWITLLLFLLGYDREYIKAAIAWNKLED